MARYNHDRKVIIYIGNKLAQAGYTPSSVDVIGPLLEQRYPMICISDKTSQFWRLIDILGTIWKNRKEAKVMLVDTYSTKGFWFAFTVALMARIIKVDYIPILHGGNLETRLSGNPGMSRFIFRGRWVKQLVAPSYFLYTVFGKYGFEKLMYIPNNLPIADYFFKRRESFSPALLWVRSFNDLYDPAMAVKVVKILSEIYPEVRLCMVGPDKDGSLQKCKDLAIASGVEHHIEFTGKLSKAEWQRRSVTYDLFINTSTVDNTPVSVMEAMALGLPVVSTNVGGIPFLLTDQQDTLLVNSGDAADMARQLRKLIDNPLLAQEIALRARKKVETFDWEIVKLSWFKLLDDAVQ